MNIITGMIRPETNCAPNEASNSSSFSSAKRSLHLGPPTEDLDQVVAGEALLDVGVQASGAPPLLDEHAL